ncbi:unnamed protein product [Vicia faba]|uniref:Myb-like protein X n=1 Tax=Vicia faba TaxID=3906 RepID=A0AAV0ZJQ1_VICFA|nr:unnamed protein product [Vicia faba]
MSRCFPFPPPGYEGKSRTDDVDLLKKERRREKKRKKEEKEKEKKERKENGEKEGRDGKHKDKKDKKEKKKKRDKDKDKDNGKDKSKISDPDGKGFPTPAQGLNDGNLHQKEIKQNDKAFLFDDRLTKQYASYNGETSRENNHQVDENRDSKFCMELDRRIRDIDGGAGNPLAQKFSTADCGKEEETVMLVAKSVGAGSSTWPDGKEKFQDRGANAKKIVGRGIQAETRSIGNATVQNHVDGKKIGTWPDGKEKFQDKGVDTKKIDGRGIWTEARPIGNATVQNHAGNCLPRVDEKPRPLENNFDKILEGTERAKEKKDDKRGDKRKDDKKGDKRKEKDKEKKGHGKDKDRDKEKKKEEKAKQKIEYRNGEQNKLKDSNKASPGGPNSSTQVSKNYHENSIFEENLKKRKEIDSNGVLHANDTRPIKLPRPSSSHPFSETGRTLEPCQISLQSASDGPRGPIIGKLENKERKKNGIIEAPTSVVSPNKIPTAIVPADPASKVPTPVVSPNKIPTASVLADPATKVSTSVVFPNKVPTVTVPADPVTKVSTKPPHPDIKYISQVWAETVHIEHADVFALPYVIPY